MKNILFVASECVPFIKTGGLADVVGALPKMIDKSQFDVRVFIPNYMCIPYHLRQQFTYINSFYMQMGEMQSRVYVGIKCFYSDGVTYYFLDNEHYFKGDKPYDGGRFDIEKFCFFCKGVLSALPVIGFRPDIIHCHDWQTGLVPVFLKTMFNDNSFFWDIKTIMTIHNLQFQGKWDSKTFKQLTGIREDLFKPYQLMEYCGETNMLKAGICCADYITTVSDTYAGEIQSPEYGEGLDALIRSKNYALCGIVNGIDYNIYNPDNDNDIFVKYNQYNFRENKYHNKRGLQHELGLPIDESKFVIAMVTRLSNQKGLDIVDYVFDYITDDHTQFIILGTGEQNYENMLRHKQWINNTHVSSNIFYSDNRAHKIYAGADAILMPSRFEPCGLTQLIALRYGTVPIVRETGGLKDTVQPYNEYDQTGTGFSFRNYDCTEMLNTINYAKHVYFNCRDAWNNIIQRGMGMDFSWRNSAYRYQELYYRLTY